MSSYNYKNVVSHQTAVGLTGTSGFTLCANNTVTTGPTIAEQNIIKHKGFILVPSNVLNQKMTVTPKYFGADGATLDGIAIGIGLGTTGGMGEPLHIPLRMKTFSGLSGGSIMFVV